MDKLERIARNIRKARISKNMTQEELALKACVSQRMLGKIERAQANPSILVLYSICMTLEISLDEITEFPVKRRRVKGKTEQ